MYKLIHHLRSHRRRAGFSQEEVAFLLGNRSGSDASHDTRLHEPTLRAAMAYEVIFRASLRELFAGMHAKVERDTIKRARKLFRRLPVERMGELKSRSLMAIVEPPVEDLRWEPIAKP